MRLCWTPTSFYGSRPTTRRQSKGCAKALVMEGVNVVTTARGANTLEATATELRALNPNVQVVTVASDITTPEGRAAALAAAPQIDKIGRAHV